MLSIWSGSIHCEINDFDVISICQYAQSMCGGPYTFAKYIFLSGKKLPQKTVNGILTNIANINKTRCFLSGIHLGDNFCRAQEMCAWDPKWLHTHKTVQKALFFQFDNDIAISWYWHQLYRYWHWQKCLLDDITSINCSTYTVQQ